MNITRTLFIFHDGENRLLNWNDTFYPFSLLLNRLLNQNYNGKKIRFMNIYFYTNNYFKKYPVATKNSVHNYSRNFHYTGLFNLTEFEKLTYTQKIEYLWEKSCEFLIHGAELTKNDHLLDAAKKAYKEGLKQKLNPDYRVIETDINYKNCDYKLAVWINFDETKMVSKFTIEKDTQIIFQKELDKCMIGPEFFLEIYKKIEFNGEEIIIKGHREIEYLPLKMLIDELI